MDINLAVERVFNINAQYSPDFARERVEQKKTGLVAGMVGALISKPKPDEIQMISMESRLEAFWLVSASVHTEYDRNASYNVPVSGSEIKRVTVLGQELTVTSNARGNAGFTLNSVEHCVEDRHVSRTLDAAGAKADLNKYLSFAKSEIPDVEHFAPEGMLVIAPQARATAVIRSILTELIKPVQAQVIHVERVDVDAIELNFRPIYALEYEWAVKGKRAVLEFDGLTGETRTDGKKFADHIKSMITRDLIFDVTADAAGMLVPGGSIAVKFAKAVMNRKK